MGYIKLLKNYKKIKGGNNEIYVRIKKLIKNNQKQIFKTLIDLKNLKDFFEDINDWSPARRMQIMRLLDTSNINITSSKKAETNEYDLIEYDIGTFDINARFGNDIPYTYLNIYHLLFLLLNNLIAILVRKTSTFLTIAQVSKPHISTTVIEETFREINEKILPNFGQLYNEYMQIQMFITPENLKEFITSYKAIVGDINKSLVKLTNTYSLFNSDSSSNSSYIKSYSIVTTIIKKILTKIENMSPSKSYSLKNTILNIPLMDTEIGFHTSKFSLRV